MNGLRHALAALAVVMGGGRPSREEEELERMQRALLDRPSLRRSTPLPGMGHLMPRRKKRVGTRERLWSLEERPMGDRSARKYQRLALTRAEDSWMRGVL